MVQLPLLGFFKGGVVLRAFRFCKKHFAKKGLLVISDRKEQNNLYMKAIPSINSKLR